MWVEYDNIVIAYFIVVTIKDVSIYMSMVVTRKFIEGYTSNK